MDIKKVTEKEFKKYGKVVEGYDLIELINKMECTAIPDGVIYEPSIDKLEELDVTKEFKESLFGGLDIQVGYCNGNNYMLNAVEYHRTSEINVAVTDMVLLLGLEQDIEDDYTYNTEKIEGFFVPKGTVVEFYGTTLHYAPCNADENGFKCVVVLPKNTNLPLEEKRTINVEDKLLFAKNKWLIGHKDSGLGSQGAFIGLKGKNISLK